MAGYEIGLSSSSSFGFQGGSQSVNGGNAVKAIVIGVVVLALAVFGGLLWFSKKAS